MAIADVEILAGRVTYSPDGIDVYGSSK